MRQCFCSGYGTFGQARARAETEDATWQAKLAQAEAMAAMEELAAAEAASAASESGLDMFGPADEDVRDEGAYTEHRAPLNDTAESHSGGGSIEWPSKQPTLSRQKV